MRDIPIEFLTRPFTTAMARAAGVTPRQLQGARFQHLMHDVYLSADVEATPLVLAAGIALVLPPDAVVGQTMAAWLHGADVRRRGDHGIEVILQRGGQLRRPGIRATSALLEPHDIVMVGGIPVSSPVRTAFDLGRRRDLIESVVGIDAMLNRGGCRLEDLAAYVAEHRGWRGVRYADAALGHAEPRAESPMESRQRMHLVLGGLPRPEAQYQLCDADGHHVVRLDHGYEEWRVGPEYDGDPHQDRWRADNERQERIRQLDWWHRRYTSLTIMNGWWRMVDEVGTGGGLGNGSCDFREYCLLGACNS